MGSVAILKSRLSCVQGSPPILAFIFFYRLKIYLFYCRLKKMLIQRHSTSSSPLTSLSVQQRQLPSTSTNPLTPLSVQQRQLPSTSTNPLTPLSVQQQKLSSSHKPHIKLNKIGTCNKKTNKMGF